MHRTLVVSRREALWLATGACLRSATRLYAGESDFWNKKEPSEWTSEEVDKLTTKSPWAKEVTVTSGVGGRGYPGGGRRGGMGGGGMGYPGGGGGMGYR